MCVCVCVSVTDSFILSFLFGLLDLFYTLIVGVKVILAVDHTQLHTHTHTHTHTHIR